MKRKSLLWMLIALACVGAVAAQINISQFPGLMRITAYNQQMAQTVTLLIALIAGILSVTSPCGFVLLPTFFSFWFKERKRAVLMTVAFSLGLALAFTLMGTVVALLGDIYGRPKTYLGRFAGLVLIIFGIMLLLNKGFSFIDFRIKHKPNRSFWGVFALGFGFALGWTPCVGPVLGSILFLAAETGKPLAGGAMMFVYALGVSIPLLVLAYLSDRGDWAGKRWITGKHVQFRLLGKTIVTHTYNLIGGTFLILIGLLMVWQKGTYAFMQTIPEYLPWNMAFFQSSNEALMRMTWLTPALANILGLLLIAGIAFLIWRHLKKDKGSRAAKKQQCE